MFDVGHSTRCYSLEYGFWKSSDETRISTDSLQEPIQEQYRQYPYHQNFLDWQNENDASGRFAIFIRHLSDRHEADADPELTDRLTLLAKKYASETVKLTKEDNARLEMLNQKVDLRYPRYSEADWKLIDEAQSLIVELSEIQE